MYCKILGPFQYPQKIKPRVWVCLNRPFEIGEIPSTVFCRNNNKAEISSCQTTTGCAVVHKPAKKNAIVRSEFKVS